MKPVDISFAERWAQEAADQIEAVLPTGVRNRGLSVHALMVGIFLTKLDGRPQHLSEVHKTLATMPPAVKSRLRIPAQLTYLSTPAENCAVVAG